MAFNIIRILKLIEQKLYLNAKSIDLKIEVFKMHKLKYLIKKLKKLDISNFLRLNICRKSVFSFPNFHYVFLNYSC